MADQQQTWLDEAPIVISVREVGYNPLEDTAQRSVWRLSRWRRGRLILAVLMLSLAIAFTVAGINLIYYAMPPQTVYVVTTNEDLPSRESQIASFFAPEVHYWEDDISRWATEYDLDPNLIATVMQIESCGDPTAGSPAGAQGLFQVMPFHFTAGEDMQDPDTNAKRGLLYLIEGLAYFEGDVTYALAGYNGGHGAVARGYYAWANETQRYYYWAVGIYQDAVDGASSSDRLNEWLSNGGSNLCNQAARVQRTLDQNS